MFGRSIRLFTVFGFRVSVDASWIFIALLVTWTLAVGFFPANFEGMNPPAYWMMGIAGALGLFGSIILHELSHSLVARRYGLNMRGITLFLFGGVAEMNEEPRNAKTEFMMAIAGPLMSLLLAGVFYLAYRGAGPDAPLWLTGVLFYLSIINLVVAGFNLIPAFPLDGGRVFRAAIWGWTKDIGKATRAAAAGGSIFAFLLIGLGLLSVMQGNLVGGGWWILIGWFIHAAARSSRRQLGLRVLAGEPVRRFLHGTPITVPPGMLLDRLVDEYIFRYHEYLYPVVDGERFVGCVTVADVRAVPREEWPYRSVASIARPCSPEIMARPEEDALGALMRMQRSGTGRMPVVDHDELLGMLDARDLVAYVQTRSQLPASKSGH